MVWELDQPRITFFARMNVPIAASIKIIVLIGVKEHAALYPSRQGLLALSFGITVLTAAMLNMAITVMETICNACIISPPVIHFSTALLHSALSAVSQKWLRFEAVFSALSVPGLFLGYLFCR